MKLRVSLKNGSVEELVTLLGTFTHVRSFLAPRSLFISRDCSRVEETAATVGAIFSAQL